MILVQGHVNFVQNLNNSMEKKAKQFDKIVGEWKLKCDDIGTELEASLRECRNLNSEFFRLKVN